LNNFSIIIISKFDKCDDKHNFRIVEIAKGVDVVHKIEFDTILKERTIAIKDDAKNNENIKFERGTNYHSTTKVQKKKILLYKIIIIKIMRQKYILLLLKLYVIQI